MGDVHRATMTHVGPVVIPPALAIAERDARSGVALLEAIAAGAEIMLRIAVALDYDAFRAKGWHTPGVVGPFGGAAAAGRLIGLDAETMARAFGLAGSQAAGTFAAMGTSAFKFHQCRGAHSGLMAALLAEQKFMAPRNFLTAPDGGLFTTYSNGGRPDAAVADLGTRWEIAHVALRLWPCAATLQGMSTALFDLVERHAILPEQVEKVRIALSKPTVDLHARFIAYDRKTEALFSAQHTAAAIVHDRALTLAQFEPERFNDPRLRRFAADKIELVADAALSGAQALVTIETSDGAAWSARCTHPRGSPENPLTHTQVELKFRDCARERLSGVQIDDVIAMVGALEALPSVASLLDALRDARR
jgi:2-methylcitrate dehydratase PrpD